jgi:hypothetical protein
MTVHASFILDPASFFRRRSPAPNEPTEKEATEAASLE